MSPWDILGWIIVGVVGLLILLTVVGIIYGLVKATAAHFRERKALKGVRKNMRALDKHLAEQRAQYQMERLGND